MQYMYMYKYQFHASLALHDFEYRFQIHERLLQINGVPAKNMGGGGGGGGGGLSRPCIQMS